MHPWTKSPIDEAIAAVGAYHEALLKVKNAVEPTEDNYMEIWFAWYELNSANTKLDKLDPRPKKAVFSSPRNQKTESR